MAASPAIRATPYEDSELVAVVRDVAEHLEVSSPEDLTQAAFDDARAAAGHPAAPTAKRICVRLHASWRLVCAAALNPDASAARFAGKRRGADERRCSLEEAATALKVVAIRLGLSMVSQRLYIKEREIIVSADRRRWQHGRQVWLPTIGQMLYGRGWDEIESAAGLEHCSKITQGTRAEDPFEQLLELLELALETKGALPNGRQLYKFARASGRLHPRRIKPYEDYLSELRNRRAVRGLWTPSAYPPSGQQPDFSEVPDEIVVSGQRRKPVWKRDECVEAVSRALDQIDGEATLRSYQRFSGGRPDYPAASAFERFGGYDAIRAEARALRRTRRTG